MERTQRFMEPELFEELLESVREGGAILRGEKSLLANLL